MWLKEERCLEGSATGAVPERDEEYQVGDEKEGQIEQEWTDALNKRYGLEVPNCVCKQMDFLSHRTSGSS